MDKSYLAGVLTGLLLGSVRAVMAFDHEPLHLPPPVFIAPAPIIIPPYPNSMQMLPPLPHAHFGADPCW